MANSRSKGRMVTKDVSNSKKIAALSPEAAVLFFLSIPHLNSFGKMHAGPAYIKEIVCPLIPYLTLKKIPRLLSEISLKTNVKWFEKDGRYWLHAIKFLVEHQNLRSDRLGPDELPTYTTKVSPEPVPNQSRTSSDLVPSEVEVEAEVNNSLKKRIITAGSSISENVDENSLPKKDDDNFDEREKAEFLKNKAHLRKQCEILINTFKDRGNGQDFDPLKFILSAVKSKIPIEVYKKVLNSMVKQKDKIKKPNAWMISVLKKEERGHHYAEALKKHYEIKSQGIPESVGEVFN